MSKRRGQKPRVIPGEEVTSLRGIRMKLEWLRRNTTPADPSDKRTVNDQWNFVFTDLDETTGSLEQARDDRLRIESERSLPASGPKDAVRAENDACVKIVRTHLKGCDCPPGKFCESFGCATLREMIAAMKARRKKS